jgi:hypothetical protein
MNTQLSTMRSALRDMKVPSHREFEEIPQESIKVNQSRLGAHPDFTSKDRQNVRPI